MDIDEIVFLSATELGLRISRKEISPVEAAEAYLRRIEKVESRLNAFITVTARSPPITQWNLLAKPRPRLWQEPTEAPCTASPWR